MGNMQCALMPERSALRSWKAVLCNRCQSKPWQVWYVAAIDLLGKIYPILGCIRLWGINDLSKLMTPHNLVHQIRLTGHERVTKLCGTLKCHHYLGIDLQQPTELSKHIAVMY